MLTVNIWLHKRMFNIELIKQIENSNLYYQYLPI